jgi:glycerophosphoryl diester phosphodiesterase
MLTQVSSTFAIVAKAGGAGERPENSHAAIAEALTVPIPDWARLVIEVDVRSSADGRLVALHDATLERTTNGTGRVRALPLSRLRQLRLGSGQEPIPVLEEVIEQVGDHELVVELHDPEPAAARALLRVLERVPAARRQRLIVASEHASLVYALRDLAPGLRSAASSREAWRKLLLERVWLDHWAPRGHTWMVPLRHRGIEVVTRRFARSARRAGDDVWAYLVDTASEAQRLRELGCTGCFTSRPRALCRELL